MDRKQTSRGTHASVLSTCNRQLFWARFSLLLFLALSITSLQTGASARATDDHSARQDKTSITIDLSQSFVRVADQSLEENHPATTSSPAKVSARNCPACQQALVECLGNGGGGGCFVQYYACIEGCQ